MPRDYMRIGELAARTAVSPEVLRAWERRYGLLHPTRTPGGFRLYTAEDLQRVEAVRDLVQSGVPASEAARRVLGEAVSPVQQTPVPSGAAREDLRRALREFDDWDAQAAFDRLLASCSYETLLSEVVLPELRLLGDEWAAGATSVAQEHFASNFLRGRLLGLARGWDQGAGPRALLACPPGEQHDLPLILFGMLLRQRGWRITFLGADTPFETIAEAMGTVRPAITVLSSPVTGRFTGMTDGLAALSGSGRVAIAGAGATVEAAAKAFCRHLVGTPAKAATELTRDIAQGLLGPSA